MVQPTPVELRAVCVRNSKAVEADSFTFHRTRAAFERDRERDAILTTAGWRVHRFTDRQLKHRPEVIASALRASLSSSGRLASSTRQAWGG